MKAQSEESGQPRAHLSTPYGKVQAFVMDSRRVYVVTGVRKPRLVVGDDRVSVDFYLVWGDRGWGLDTFASCFEGREGPVKADVRAKIVRAVASEVVVWLARLPRS